MEKSLYPKIEKFINEENVSQRGAFSSDAFVTFRLTVPRRLGTSCPIMRIRPDEGEDRDIDFEFVSTDAVNDVYKLTLCPSELLGGDGLLFYTFVFPNGYGAFFTTPYNNVDFELTDNDCARFTMLVYTADFTTPEWLGDGVMYQVFVDRFCKGKGSVAYREDSVIDPDWENGVPQYGERAGSHVENNVFFGGNLWGVAEKLPYLASLGVTVLYLNPIFEARSNHKYDIGDYLKIDDGFGGEAAFKALLKKAKKLGIRVVLDGVFNHTGDDSRYFDRFERYGEGAYNNEDSPYNDWYKWKSRPDEYECWWGIKIMPRLNNDNPQCRHFFTAPGGVADKYIKMGVSGWRLDVADELCDDFLDELRETVRAADPDAAIIGEVWENAAEKISYGSRRRYLRGGQLDSVMNYPLRNGIIAFVKDGDAGRLYDVLVGLYGTYPRQVCDCLMNIIGTHDTERILTVLGGKPDLSYDNATLAALRMTDEEKKRAVELLKMASVIQYTVYGIPSLYYGDEAGVEGYHDPFCRLPFPWGRENAELTEHYRVLGELRRDHKAFASGDFRVLSHGSRYIAYERKKGKDCVVVAVNRGKRRTIELDGRYRDVFTRQTFDGAVELKTDGVLVLERI